MRGREVRGREVRGSEVRGSEGRRIPTPGRARGRAMAVRGHGGARGECVLGAAVPRRAPGFFCSRPEFFWGRARALGHCVPAALGVGAWPQQRWGRGCPYACVTAPGRRHRHPCLYMHIWYIYVRVCRYGVCMCM